jgi:hypothetical protein
MPVENLVDDIIRLQELVPEYLDDCVHNILHDTPKMIGFTTTFEQNSASVALAKVIKGSIDLPIFLEEPICLGEPKIKNSYLLFLEGFFPSHRRLHLINLTGLVNLSILLLFVEP